MRRISIDRYRELAAQHEGYFRGDKAEDVRVPVPWQCQHLHPIWLARYDSVRRGSWCPHCAGNIVLTIKECDELAVERGGLCLSREYVNSRTPLNWQCAKSHIWWARFGNIKQGSWCPVCSGLIRFTIEQCHEIAAKREGLCLSREYTNDHTPLDWQCANGHVWHARPGSVKQGSWCPYCARVARLTIEQCQALAAKQDGLCLSEECGNAHTKLHWQCTKGHMWWATPDNIQRGTWCPYCSRRHSRLETTIFEYVRGLYPSAKSGVFGLLKSKHFELDIWIPSLRKAIEFDGTYWHASPWAIENGSAEREVRKNAQCLETGIQLLRIPEAEFKTDPTTVYAKIDKFLSSSDNLEG